MNIFVGNLAKTITVEELRRVFSDYGTVVKAIVMKDTASGKPLGYAHVYVEPAQAGQEAISDLDAAPLKGKPIVARECVTRAKRDRRVVRKSWSGVERRNGERRRNRGG
jgi:RNA recognition motif-containing protein